MFLPVLLLLAAGAGEPLRLEDALSRANTANPALRAEAAAVEAVERRAEREALGQPYVVGGELENVAGTGSLGGMRSAEATVSIARVIELGGKRSARQALGQAQLGQQQNVAVLARRDLAFRTHQRFIEVLADQQRLVHARLRLERMQQTLDEVQSWVNAARNPETDLHAARIAVAEAELQVEHAEHELQSARTTLSASWGALTPDFSAAAGDLLTLPVIDSFETLAANLSMSPEQQASLREAETIAARRRMARAAEKPDVTVSLGVRRLEAFNDQGLVMSFSLPLGARPRSARAVAEADAQLDSVNARREADRFELHQALFERYQELGHARNEAETVAQRMLPMAEQALAFTRNGFEAGRFTYFALAQAETTMFELRDRLVEASVRYHFTLAEVQRLAAVAPETSP